MRIYADSSFLVKLIVREQATEDAVGEYRRLGLPRLCFLPLHAVEVENAVRLRAFVQRQTLPAGQRAGITRECATALSKLEAKLQRGDFLSVVVDWDEVMHRARQISQAHTERIGARALDVLHVACALELEAEHFLTADKRQALLAKAEGMTVGFVENE